MPREGLIIKALSGFYYVRTAEGDTYQTRARGIFRYQDQVPLVGDRVIFEAENLEEGTIVEILKRTNELTRPPVANVDVGVIVSSMVSPKLSTHLLDRFLVILESKQIEPVVFISKLDLADHDLRENLDSILTIYEQIGYHFIVVDETTESIYREEVRQAFAKQLDQQIIVFIGQSGAGKSTLLNILDPDLNLKTAEISKALGRGKHTTRHVELLPLFNGWFADTPGFSMVDLKEIEATELAQYFPEIWKRRAGCKFSTCLHHSEPHCAVKEAVAKEEIADFRYAHYLDFLSEIQSQAVVY